MGKPTVVEADEVVQHTDRPDDLGEALQLLCNKYGAWVRLPVQGMTAEKYKLLVFALVPYGLRCRWVQLSDRERAEYVEAQMPAALCHDRLHIEGVL
jgi:hypothetical protein